MIVTEKDDELPDSLKKGPEIDILGFDFNMEEIVEELNGAPFPASKEELIAFARDKDMGQEVILMLETLPDNGKAYNSAQEVKTELEHVGDDTPEAPVPTEPEAKPAAEPS